MKQPQIPMEEMLADMESPVIKDLSTMSVSALLVMLDVSVRQMIMRVLPALATVGLCARMKSMVTLASVFLDTKAATVT